MNIYPHKKLLIFQPYVADYRVEFFGQLFDALAAQNIEMKIVSGSPDRRQGMRDDAINSAVWELRKSELSIPIFGTRFRFKLIGLTALRSAKVLVHELAASNINSLISCLLFARKTIIWGHAGSFTKAPNKIDQKIEKWMCNRASRVFVYTPKGAEYLEKLGIRSGKIEILFNTIDLSVIEFYSKQLGYRHECNGPTALFIGGIDKSKNIDFLITAADEALAIDPKFKLLVAGDGEDRSSLLKEIESRNHISYLGRLDAEGKVRNAMQCCAIWMPGRVGLIAVDALILKRKILTLSDALHAPEVEYLASEREIFYLDPDPKSFADWFISNIEILHDVQDLSKPPQLGEMVQRFAKNVIDVCGVI